jgi:hypothetical protein
VASPGSSSRPAELGVLNRRVTDAPGWMTARISTKPDKWKPGERPTGGHENRPLCERLAGQAVQPVTTGHAKTENRGSRTYLECGLPGSSTNDPNRHSTDLCR